MITNRTMPSSVNVFQITVRRGIADGSLQGCVKSHSLGLQAQFSSLSRMVILIEEWLDFAVPVPPCKPDAAEVADFEIEILFRQNCSWQGVLRSLHTGQEAVFRSVLELLMQMEAALA